jgi:hypothetical protein
MEASRLNQRLDSEEKMKQFAANETARHEIEGAMKLKKGQLTQKLENATAKLRDTEAKIQSFQWSQDFAARLSQLDAKGSTRDAAETAELVALRSRMQDHKKLTAMKNQFVLIIQKIESQLKESEEVTQQNANKAEAAGSAQREERVKPEQRVQQVVVQQLGMVHIQLADFQFLKTESPLGLRTLERCNIKLTQAKNRQLRNALFM